MKAKELRLGLDLGTDSVGWALLDENNHLIKKNGFTFWGVRMFEEAKDASERRGYRNSRRRLNRRRQRIELLQQIFAEEINKVDSTFFQRLNDSFYKIEDKKNGNYYNLFNGEYTDQQFFRQYPTIFHLRKELIHSNEKADIRFIYLALHNIIKFRGNFLISGDEFKTSDYTQIKNSFIELNTIISELNIAFEEEDSYKEEFFDLIDENKLNDEFFGKLQEILVHQRSLNERKNSLKQLFNVSNKSIIAEAIIPLIAGSSKINMAKLSVVRSSKYENFEIELAKESLEDDLDEGKSKIPELSSLFDYILRVKEIVDFYYVIKILKKPDITYSEAMVQMYDEHQQDLNRLKKFFKIYLKKEYHNFFRKVDKKINNYPHYVGFNSVNGSINRYGHCSRTDFYAYLKKLLDKVTIEEAKSEKDYFLLKMENNEFLLRQNSDQNGSFPMQLHLTELKRILNNQKKYYPFLLEESDGITNYDKIIAIFKYKLPYFVGPLNQNSEYSWVERTNEKITPWNYKDVINMDETAIRFIERMQNKCSYLKGPNDYCLPKKSILFSEYNCLSYLNKLSIDGSLISTDVKMGIMNEVFMVKKSPTKKDIINYLKSNFGANAITTTNEKSLPEINCDMSSYIKFKEIFGNQLSKHLDMIEDIIRDITIFEDKGILETRLEKVYHLDKDKIKKIKDLNYKGYGRLSKKLLNELPVVHCKTGEIAGTVIEVMRKTNLNLQEILYSEDYRFIDTIDQYNLEHQVDTKEKITDFIDENISVSPSFKRPIIQAIGIINDIEKAFGRKIDKYYVECTRTNKAKKGATSSRYTKLKEIYKKCKDFAQEYKINIKELEEKLDENQKNLKSDLLYLYFTQLGRCMYTLEPIDFDDLFKNYKFDIDHIYPQSIIKDDSLSNRVLTNKSKNAEKSDHMLSEMPGFLPKDAYAFYGKLMDLELISKEKYKRLTKKFFTEDELNGFVNRQLVTTNQAVKGLIETLKLYKKVDQSNIIYSKAENISDFRHTYDLVKSRMANNYHHAHDAYLNVIVGNTLNEYYQSKKYYYMKDYERIKNEGYSLNPSKIMLKDSITVQNHEIWNKNEMIKQVKHDLYERYDVHETIRAYNSNDMFSKVTILPAAPNSKSVPVQTTTPRANVDKYGGITSNSYSQFVILKDVNKKGIVNYILLPIPRTYKNRIEEYIRSEGYTNFEVLHNNIKINVVILDGALKYCITGVSGNSYLLKNMRDRNFNYDNICVIKKIEKYLENKKLNNIMISDDNKVIIAPAKNNQCKEISLSYEEVKSLIIFISNMFKKSVYKYSNIISNMELLDVNYLNDFNINELIELASELLKLLKTNERKTANLTILGGVSSAGTLYFNRTMKKGIQFISESPTGYYKKVLFEVK